MADDLAVVEVDQEAYVVPSAAHANVREVRDDMGPGRVSVETPVDQVGDRGVVRLGRLRLEARPRVRADQALRRHHAPYPASRGGHPLGGQAHLDAGRAVLPAAVAPYGDHVACYRIWGAGPLGVLERPIVGRPRDAQGLALR